MVIEDGEFFGTKSLCYANRRNFSDKWCYNKITLNYETTENVQKGTFKFLNESKNFKAQHRIN